MKQEIVVPEFATEAEEARWWYEHREAHDAVMLKAMEEGRTTTVAEVLRRAKFGDDAPPTVSVPIDPEDVGLARKQAETKGMRYQIYLKMLLHEALLREEGTKRAS